MRLSNYFLPTTKETPSDAVLISHQLMLKAGLIHKTTSGIYSWLPLGLKVLQKIEQIVAEEQDKIGCKRILMPSIQPAELWYQSKRFNTYGNELLKIKDRHERELCYGPTHEEVITDLMKNYIQSYKQLPQIFYQISWKFRDEIRPRFGVMRGREFFMKDGYSFDLDYENAQKTYYKIFGSYLKTFKRLGIKAIPLKADPGEIGGNLSHEFHIPSNAGESVIYYDSLYDEKEMALNELLNIYAVTEEKHDLKNCPIPKERLIKSHGIEVGHIFYFGKKYSNAFDMKVLGPDGSVIYPEMGSYGIGISRLVAAIIEVNHDERGMIWPESVAPFDVALIQIDQNQEEFSKEIYNKLQDNNVSVLYDDRNERAGVKFADMDLIGLPWQIIIGKNAVQTKILEIKNRRTNERFNWTIEQFLDNAIFKI
ncbi:MAG: proline--tRNA ligase [Alphaproteobacteria bacterium]